MPPRIPLANCLRAQNAPQTSAASRVFPSTPSCQASTVAQKRKSHDPYLIAQAKARKAANLSRQEVLKKERAAVLGDPVRGTTTPFVQSFDTATSPERNTTHANFFLSEQELSRSINRSKWLIQPPPSVGVRPGNESDGNLAAGMFQANSTNVKDSASDLDISTSHAIAQLIDDSPWASRSEGERQDFGHEFLANSIRQDREKRAQEEHNTAEEAIKRISSLSIGSSKDRLRVNIQRCVDEFGRHHTDKSLPPKPRPAVSGQQLEAFPRVGPDTGSSEVQIAILTAKIRTLASSLELRGHPDKVNKRNLRLLVHRRAKLLQYLRRKERGGPRWQNTIQKLGLTEGTWKGEISL